MTPIHPIKMTTLLSDGHIRNIYHNWESLSQIYSVLQEFTV